MNATPTNLSRPHSVAAAISFAFLHYPVPALRLWQMSAPAGIRPGPQCLSSIIKALHRDRADHDTLASRLSRDGRSETVDQAKRGGLSRPLNRVQRYLPALVRVFLGCDHRFCRPDSGVFLPVLFLIVL